MADKDIDRLQKWFEHDTFYSKLAASVLVLFCLLWFVLGFVVPCFVSVVGVPEGATRETLTDWLPRAANIGDMFGVANSFFSALALLFVAATLWFQMRQTQIAHKTSLIQAFLFLADLHHRLMTSAHFSFQKGHHEQAEYCAKRATDLMRTLDDKLPEYGVEPVFRTKIQEMYNELSVIHSRFKFGTHARNADDNKMTIKSCWETYDALKAWQEKYKEMEIVRMLDQTLDDLHGYSERMGLINPYVIADSDAVKALWNDFWARLDMVVVYFDSVYKAIGHFAAHY